MYKVLIKIDGEYLYMLEAFENGSMDIVSLLVIIYCISIAYRKRYSLKARAPGGQVPLTKCEQKFE